MSTPTTDLYADLIRRAEACDVPEKRASDGAVAFAQGKAAAYRHAAELLRGAVAAAVEEEREAAAHECEVIAALCGGDEEADSPTVRVLRGAARAIRRPRGVAPWGRCERRAGGGGVMHTEPAPIPLGLRHPAFDGYTLTVRGVVDPSGAMYGHMHSEAAAREWLRKVVTEMRPDDRAAARGASFVDFLLDVAVAAARSPVGFDEGALAVMILAWITAETIGATWETCGPRGLS